MLHDPLKCWLFYNFIISPVFLMVDTFISGLWWSWSRYCSIDPPMQCTSCWCFKETKTSVPTNPRLLGKIENQTVFCLELSSKRNYLPSKASNVSQVLSNSTQQNQNQGIAVIILKNLLPHKKTCLYHWKTFFTVMQ